METPFRAVLAGCGGVSKTWLTAARTMPDLEIVGLVDVVASAARDRADEFGLDNAVVGTELAPVLEQTTPEIVFDCTIPEAHAGITLEALRHGCHVLGEKPLSTDMESARQMIAAAQEAGRLYAVTQNRRYNPYLRRIRRWLDEGHIGALTTVHSDAFIGAHFGGFREQMEHVLLKDRAIHVFDAARFITGANARTAYCHEWNPSGSWYQHDASAVAIFEMTGGIVYTFRGSWVSEGLPTSWDSQWRIIGERGTITWNGADDLRAQVVAETGGFLSTVRDVDIPELLSDEQAQGHSSVIREFLGCVRTGAVPETAATDNIHSLAMVFGAVASSTSGSRVAVEAG